MVAVQVREQDALDLRGLNTEALHRHERRGPAIDKKLGGLSLQVDAGLKSTSASEGIAAPQKPNAELYQ